MSMSQAEKRLRGQVAANTSWSNTTDPSARTRPARDKFAERFIDEVDPERTLPEAERHRRAESARRAYFARLALASAKARRRKATTQ